ncbi:LuxR C-terminal-related transcriptional regulator [Streptomyces sp. G45]|uniref:helix-turn-helix transcriptional regulator n=1 Tax=Streptomyces sp. G45 TaxID=3406627 RepID=UPI003C26A0B3
MGLLYDDATDPGILRAMTPTVALPHLLSATADDITQHRRRGKRLAIAFDALMRDELIGPPPSGAMGYTVLRGLEEINDAIMRAMDAAHNEALFLHPGRRIVDVTNVDPTSAVAHTEAFLARGGRTRTLYQHTSRYSSWVHAYYEQLRGPAEVRTLDELPQRLFVFDDSTAFIPGPGQHTALQIHQAALIRHFITVFDLLWRLATPLFPTPTPQPTVNGITARQRSIASLLIEGLTDAQIASRLSMNVRTVRVHIAKLSDILHSKSRAELGYLIGKSELLNR